MLPRKKWCGGISSTKAWPQTTTVQKSACCTFNLKSSPSSTNSRPQAKWSQLVPGPASGSFLWHPLKSKQRIHKTSSCLWSTCHFLSDSEGLKHQRRQRAPQASKQAEGPSKLSLLSGARFNPMTLTKEIANFLTFPCKASTCTHGIRHRFQNLSKKWSNTQKISETHWQDLRSSVWESWLTLL